MAHFYLLHDEGPYHIETSPYICPANRWTGFYMIGNSAIKELTNLNCLCCGNWDKKAIDKPNIRRLVIESSCSWKDLGKETPYLKEAMVSKQESIRSSRVGLKLKKKNRKMRFVFKWGICLKSSCFNFTPSFTGEVFKKVRFTFLRLD